MTKYFQIIAFVLLALAATAQTAHAEETTYERVMKTKTINCGYFVWAPFTVKDPNTGKFSGINVEIMEAVGKNLGFKINWVAEVGVGDTVAALNTGKVDAVCSTLWPSPQRSSQMTSTKAEFYDEFYAFVRKGDKRFDGDITKADTNAVTITGIDNDVTADVANEKLPKAKKLYLPQTATASDALMNLMTKKADLVFIDASTVDEFSKTNPDQIAKVGGMGPIRTSGEQISLKQGEYQLRDMMNTALTQLVNDDVIEQITQRYSKQYNSKFMAPRKSFE